VAKKPATLGEMGHAAEETELSAIVERQQPGQEQAPEQRAEHPHRQEEGGTCGNPALAIWREATSWYNHVDVRVMGECRTPCMKDGGDADTSAEMPGVAGDDPHGLGRGPEQQIIYPRLVLQRDGGDLGRQRENDMKIPDRQEVGLALGKPRARGRTLTLGAVSVTAAVVGNTPMAAVRASLDVAAHRSGATMLDSRHDLELVEAEMPGVRGPVHRTCSSEDVGDLDSGAHPTSAA
jgi:hypothetical protein